MFPKLPPVAFDLLDQGSIQDLTASSLDQAASAVLDALTSHSDGVVGVLRQLADSDVDALREGLWQTHLAPRIRCIPDPNPYADEEPHVLQEAGVRLLREVLRRQGMTDTQRLLPGMLRRQDPVDGDLAPIPDSAPEVRSGSLLLSLGDLHAIDLVVLIDDLRGAIPSPG